MDRYSAYGGYGHPTGYGGGASYGNSAQQYQASPPQIRNPFAPPPTADFQQQQQQQDFEQQQYAQWQATYAPADQQDRGKKGGRHDRLDHTAVAGTGEGGEGKAKSGTEDNQVTVVRKGGGETWEDRSLLEWDPKQFRIMVGNLAGEVTDDSLAKAFAAYGVAKARVVRDKRTTKSRGYGFVSFEDHDRGFRAAREMVGKYIGSHPVTIQRSKTNVAPVARTDSANNHHHKSRGGKNGHQNKKKDGKDGGSHNNNNGNSVNSNGNNHIRNEKDPLRANTGAGIEKKPAKAPAGLKLLG